MVARWDHSRQRDCPAGAGSLAIPRAVAHGLAACRGPMVGDDHQATTTNSAISRHSRSDTTTDSLRIVGSEARWRHETTTGHALACGSRQARRRGLPHLVADGLPSRSEGARQRRPTASAWDACSGQSGACLRVRAATSASRPRPVQPLRRSPPAERRGAASKPGPRGRGGHRRRAGDGHGSKQAAVGRPRDAGPRGPGDGSDARWNRLTDGCGHTLEWRLRTGKARSPFFGTSSARERSEDLEVEHR